MEVVANGENVRRKNGIKGVLRHPSGEERETTERTTIPFRPSSANLRMVNWTRTARSTSDCMVMEGIIEIGIKNGTITTGIGVRGVVCPVDLPVRLKVCAVECSKMEVVVVEEEEEEGAVDPIRTIGGVVEIDSATTNVTVTTVTVDTRHQTTIVIIETGIEVTGPTKTSEDTRPRQEVTLAITTQCHLVATILRVTIRTDMVLDTIEAEDRRVAVVLAVTLWTTGEVVVEAEAVGDEVNTTGGHHHQPTRSCRIVSKETDKPTTTNDSEAVHAMSIGCK